MRLFSTATDFMIHHLTPTLSFTRFQHTCLIWTPPAAFFPGQAASWVQPLCSPCQAQRDEDVFRKKEFETMSSLHCSGCKIPHKKMHFSTIMRGEPNDDERLCLGHEFPLQICSHELITLNQVKFLAKYKSHESFVCNRYEPRGRLNHTAQGRGCMSLECYEAQPRYRCYTDDSGNTRLQLEFAVHIKFKRLLSRKACPHSLRDEIRNVRKIDRVGQWKDFFFFAGVDPERCFDPNICDCVEYIPPSYQGSHIRFGLCSEGQAALRERAPATGSPYLTTTGRCAFARHGTTSHYKGMEINLDFLRCLGRRDSIILKQTIDCLADTRYASGSGGWGNLVTRLSYNADRDQLLTGLVTCSDWHCGLHLLSTFSKDAGLYMG